MSLLGTSKVENLLAGDNVKTVTNTKHPLAADQGDLKRGQMLELDSLELNVISASYQSFSLSVLAVDVATSVSTQAVTVYDTGEFNANAVITDDETTPTITISDIEAACRQQNIHFKENGNNAPV